MNRELDRQIAINFIPETRILIEDLGARNRGLLKSSLAWDTFLTPIESKFRLENGGSWTYCKDNIWATENLPHYSEDLNMAIKLHIPEGWEIILGCDKEGVSWVCRYEEYTCTIEEWKQSGRKCISSTSLNPAEAVCMARLKLKEQYGI